MSAFRQYRAWQEKVNIPMGYNSSYNFIYWMGRVNMPDEKDVPKSQQGFVALDLDGMTMVQKIDQNFFYGWSNTESHIRQSLIEYIRTAQKRGFDIYILTARPSLIEPLLRSLNLGTKPTGEIVAILELYEIKIKSIERNPRGLKGDKMLDMLKSYRDGGAPHAVGILFDDQLIQVNSVNSKNDEHLLAYDINSKKDLEDFVRRVPLQDGEDNSFHPLNIVRQVLNPAEELIKNGYQVSEESIKLRNLKETLDRVSRENYPKEVELIEEIIDDLCVRLYEAQHRHYQPEIAWVANATAQVKLLVDKLLLNRVQLSHEDIKAACVAVLGKSSLSKIQPNTHCGALLKELFEHMQMFPLITDLRNQCVNYQAHLSAIIDGTLTAATDETSDSVVQDQLSLLKQLHACLDLTKTINPTTALQKFTTLFIDNRATLAKTRIGNECWESIRRLLIIQIHSSTMDLYKKNW